MRFVFFYDRVVNINQIVYLMKHRKDNVSSPEYIMKLTDGSTMMQRASDGETEKRLDKLIKNLQVPNLELVYNLYVSDYEHPKG